MNNQKQKSGSKSKEKKIMKPRICYVNPPLLLKRPISELIDKLNAKGYETSLLLPKKVFKKRDESLHHSALADKSRIYTYSIINPPISSEQPIPITPAFCVSTFKAIKNNDIIHMWVPYYLTSFKIILIKKLFYPKKKLILTMDTVPGYSFSMGKFWNSAFRIYNKLFGWIIFKTPDSITLYGKSLVPFAIRAGVPREKIRVISTGVDIKKYSAIGAVKKGKFRKEQGISSKTSIITYAGLIIPRKGIDKIIKMAKKLENEDLVFVLAGDGHGRKEYQAKAKRLGLNKKILFLGWRKDMNNIYADTDILILASEGEGLPGIVMEAMAAGIPVVASNIPCLPDLVDNGQTGFLCNKDDIDEFVLRIKELVHDKKRSASFSKNTLQKIKGFDWNKVVNEYEKIYQQISQKVKR